VSKLVKILIISCVSALLIIPPGNYFSWDEQWVNSQSDPPSVIILTAKEKEWIQTHQPIRIAFDGYFPPYSFISQSGKLAGISYDTIKLITDRLNIQIKIDKRTLWKDIYQAGIDKEIDVIATMVKRTGREFQFAFTQPYVFKSLVIIAPKTDKSIKSRNDLPGKTIALVKSYQYSKRILDEFPSITPFYVDKMQDALIAVETGQADAAISFFAASYYLQNKHLFSQIKFAAFYDRNSSNESIAVRNDWPMLVKILQKGLNSLSASEKQAIKIKWHPQIELPVDYKTISRIIIVFLFILFTLLTWIVQIKRQSKRLKKTKNELQIANSELNTFKENLENLVLLRTEQLQNSEQKYRSLVENLRDEYFFYQYDKNRVYTYLSPSITNILGYKTDDILKHDQTFLTDHPDNENIKDFIARSLNGEQMPAYEIEVFDKKGHKCCLEVLENPVYDDNGEYIGFEGIAHDITLLKQTRDRLSWLSYYDDLTGLANRRLFTDRIEQMIILSNRNQKSIALLFLDIDRFKMVNDSLGHAAGDEVLKETASRLQAQLRDSDIAARMGGDEFTLVLPDTDTHAAEIVTKKILKHLLTPYDLNGQQFILGSSIGIAIYPKDATDVDGLLQQADNAMYLAKKEKTGYAFSSSDQHHINGRRILLEQSLRKALIQNCYDESFELKIVFQSKHNIQKHKLIGYEALMRWQHPELGLISPIEFIPLAEETGLIVELSRWVINRVCRQTVIWTQAGFDFGKVAINISAVELINFELATNIIQLIDSAGAQRELIEIEITETALMKTPDVAIKVMQQLVNAGVLIAIDDFGTGYSSLSYLKNLPASYIKIDQSFIRNLLNSPEDQAVVKAVVAMSHALGKKVIAEGVETEEQLQFLTENNCDIAQGYLFSKPVSAEIFS